MLWLKSVLLKQSDVAYRQYFSPSCQGPVPYLCHLRIILTILSTDNNYFFFHSLVFIKVLITFSLFPPPSQSFYFDRDDVALKGFAKYFKNASDEERGHAETFMGCQNKRGGRVILQDIRKPIKQEWASGLEAMTVALELEKTVNQALLDLHKIFTNHNDPQVDLSYLFIYNCV